MIETVVITELVTDIGTGSGGVVEPTPGLVETDTLVVIVMTETAPEVIEVFTP